MASFSRNFSTQIQSNLTHNLSVSLNQSNGQVNYSYPAPNSLFQALQTLAYCILIIMSLVGNTFVIATVVRNTNKRMRSVSNILIVNLSIADLLVSLVNMPSKIAQIYIGHIWLISGTLGFILCKIMNLVPFLAVFVSTQSFAVLALDRFVAVYFPVKKPITTKVAYVLLGLVWLLSIAFFYAYCHSAIILSYDNRIYCTIDTHIVFGGIRGFKVFVWIEFTVVILIPLLIALVLYAATMVRLWTRKVPGNVTSTNTSYTERVNRKVLKMLVSVFLVFFFCWLPSWIWIINCVRLNDITSVPDFCLSESFHIARFIIAYSNSAITPLIYLMFSENYRQGFNDILVAIACCSSVRAALTRNNRVRPSMSMTLQERARGSHVGRRTERLDFTTVI